MSCHLSTSQKHTAQRAPFRLLRVNSVAGAQIRFKYDTHILARLQYYGLSLLCIKYLLTRAKVYINKYAIGENVNTADLLFARYIAASMTHTNTLFSWIEPKKKSNILVHLGCKKIPMSINNSSSETKFEDMPAVRLSSFGGFFFLHTNRSIYRFLLVQYRFVGLRFLFFYCIYACSVSFSSMCPIKSKTLCTDHSIIKK